MVRVEVLGSDYFQNKRDVTRMRCTRKSLNCIAHAIDDQNNGRWVSANQPMVEHRPHAIQHFRRMQKLAYDILTRFQYIYLLFCKLPE